MNAVPGRAGRLAVVAALCGMVAALAAPHLGDLSAGPPDTDPIDGTDASEAGVESTDPEPTAPS